jgi:hypothetical protein
LSPAFRGLPIFDKREYLADRDLIGSSRQPIAAFGPTPRFDEAALLEARENQLQDCVARSKIACKAYSPLTEMFKYPIVGYCREKYQPRMNTNERE